jgi:hypothetical protein
MLVQSILTAPTIENRENLMLLICKSTKAVRLLGTLIFTTLVPAPVLAQQIDGLYRPDFPWAASWSCSADHLGSDGGSLGILDGKLHGVENMCELGPPRPVTGGQLFSATCSGEGETYTTDYIIATTPTGLSLTRDGETVQWRRCDAVTDATPLSSWVSGFAMGVNESSTRDNMGNSIILSCRDGRDGRVYVELAGKPVDGGAVQFNIDGEDFSFPVWAEGGRVNVECTACADNYTELWRSLRSGNHLTITQGGSAATLSLRGTSDALAPEPCTPEGW